MEVVATDGNRYILNFARGEELFETLLVWSNKNEFASATLTGLGAADEIEIAYYNLTTKEYERQVVQEEVEICSLIGNLGVLNGERMLHIHGVFGRRDLSTFGGHLFSLRVSGACEVHVTTLAEAAHRAFNEETGLNLLCAVQ